MIKEFFYKSKLQKGISMVFKLIDIENLERKYFEREGKRMLPLAIQVHHAVCDGYHVGVFVERLQGYIDNFSV